MNTDDLRQFINLKLKEFYTEPYETFTKFTANTRILEVNFDSPPQHQEKYLTELAVLEVVNQLKQIKPTRLYKIDDFPFVLRTEYSSFRSKLVYRIQVYYE